ncbi:MAG TPA: MFS transporter [Alphaproteobacteria bacterium]|nr:MFS transporter [Alphaproteobacteria bacterium]
MSQTETTQAVGGDAETSIFRIRPFQLMFFTRLASMMSNQMLAVVVGWQVLALTDSPVALGLIGLVQLMPALFFALFAGEVADRYDRRLVLRWVYVVQTSVVVGFLLVSLMDEPHVGLLYALLFVNALSRTFESPALQSLLPSLVPPYLLSRAIAAYASSARTASLLGPSIGGAIYAFGVATDYICCLVLISIAATVSFMLPPPPAVPAMRRSKVTWQTMSAGVSLIWSSPLLFSVISLDLLATIFGGLTALLPIFARDILEIGPWGLGILRSAPAAGALVMALVLSQVPVTRSCGWVILGGAAVYGASSILFGVSTNTIFSLAMLLLFGASDAISAVNRKTLMQTTTPNELLGRVSAVSTFSNTMGNQLGQLESGLTAAVFGTVGSVLFGGVSVLLIVAVWAWRYPQLRSLERPDAVEAFAPRPAA